MLHIIFTTELFGTNLDYSVLTTTYSKAELLALLDNFYLDCQDLELSYIRGA